MAQNQPICHELRAKWNSCTKFRQSLLSTEGMVVAVATSCDFWGVGVAPNLAQHTKPTKFLGQNHMGKLQMALRCHVAQPGVLNDDGEIALPLKPEYTPDSTANPDGSISAILESLTMSPALIEQGQGDSSEIKAGPSDSTPVHLPHPPTLCPPSLITSMRPETTVHLPVLLMMAWNVKHPILNLPRPRVVTLQHRKHLHGRSPMVEENHPHLRLSNPV